MTVTFRILSALLSYPSEDLQVAASEFADLLGDDAILSPIQIEALRPLLASLAKDDLIELQERYVGLFDRSRTLSLHIFEHVHGESRDRGQAMVDLKAHYAEYGLEITATELPDYLPLFLEFLSSLPKDEAFDLLGQPGSVLATLAERLDRRETPYAAVLAALAALANAKLNADLASIPDDDPNDLEALDAAWAAEEISFGAGAALGAQDGGCPQADAMVARFAAPAVQDNGSAQNG